MKKLLLITALWLFALLPTTSQADINETLPVRGLCIAAPSPDGLIDFLTFIEKELAPRNINTLILRVDYRYEYKSHPELNAGDQLDTDEVKQLLECCRKYCIRLIPQVNLLGHQSWHSKNERLLEVYPEFDETPHIKLPEKYEWPNADGLYCKSYCPLHPEVHDVVFDIVDEICDVFEADAFHAGMDEVFYIGDDHCPRCAGKNKAGLFAAEVQLIRDHLAENGRQLWIWGDRLLDGKITGIGMWEASENDTHQAIDLIPKDVFICDWHYERADPSPVFFAMLGFDVAICPYKKVDVAISHLENMNRFRKTSAPQMKERYQGIIQTVWTSCDRFLDEFYGTDADPLFSETASFKAIFPVIPK